MSGAREFIRNGQPHFISSQKVVNLRHKTRTRVYHFIPFMVLFIFASVGLIGFLYYLNVKLNNDIGEYNDKINVEIKQYAEKMNDKLLELEKQLATCNAKIQELEKKLDKKQATDAQGTLQESDTNKFKAEFFELVEEFPVIENIEFDDIGKGGLVVMRENNTGKLFDHFQPPPSHPRPNKNKTVSEELVNGTRLSKRQRRGAEIANANGVNLIDPWRENESTVKHDVDVSTALTNESVTSNEKRSGLPNQTSSSKGSQCHCCGTPCDDTVPRKTANLQKNANKRSLQTKKSQNIREEVGPSLGEWDDSSADITEVRKTVIAAHYGADSSRYSVRTHAHYEGNGRLRHPTGEYEDWKASSWFEELNMSKHFVMVNGNIKVHSAGLYFVYAQIFYTDLSDVNGYAIFQNSQIVLQCITSAYTLNNVTAKSNTCFTGGVIKCDIGDKISIKTMDANRKVLLESTRSFVGMFKIGEFQNVN